MQYFTTTQSYNYLKMHVLNYLISQIDDRFESHLGMTDWDEEIIFEETLKQYN